MCAGKVISEAAAEKKADSVVVGARGLGAFKRCAALCCAARSAQFCCGGEGIQSGGTVFLHLGAEGAHLARCGLGVSWPPAYCCTPGRLC